MTDSRRIADPRTYNQLLQLIAQVESGDNYNAYYGNARNTKIKFTEMSIAEVLDWQDKFVASGNPSSAVGRYQIINTTLADLVKTLDIDSSQKFDKSTQDQLAAALMERRGLQQYVNNELSPEQFAANLAKEWAALPRIIGDNPEASYYAGDGLNHSRIKPAVVLKTIHMIGPL